MEKKNVIFLSVIAVATLLTAVIGTTFAYFTANFTVSNNDAVNSVKTKKLASTTIVVGEAINSTTAYPGFKGAQSLTIKGAGDAGDVSAKAKITVTDNLTDFGSDVTWKLVEVEPTAEVNCKSDVKSNAAEGGVQYYDNASCTGLTGSETTVLSSSTTKTTTIDVAYNTNKKYYLVVEYANKENQDAQQGKTFTVKVSAEQVANS